MITLLNTGETPDGDFVGGEMGKVVANTGKLSACGSRRHGDIPEIATAGPGSEAAGKK